MGADELIFLIALFVPSEACPVYHSWVFWLTSPYHHKASVMMKSIPLTVERERYPRKLWGFHAEVKKM